MTPGVIYTRIPETDRNLVKAAAEIGVADLQEALGPVTGRKCLMGPSMRPLSVSWRIAGPAVTALDYPGDNLMMHQALYLATAGQVLVVSNGGSSQGALWGELTGIQAQRKGVAGLVAHGAVRDTGALLTMNFPVWSTAIHASHSEKRGPGAVNVPIVVDGVTVHPGDIIVADADGVIAISPNDLPKALEGAEQRRAKETEMKRRLAAGETLYKMLNIARAINACGLSTRETTWQNDADR